MPTRDEILYEKTYKDVEELDKRVFYTLWGEQDRKQELRIRSTIHFLSSLVKHLHDKGIISVDDLDDFLLDAAT